MKKNLVLFALLLISTASMAQKGFMQSIGIGCYFGSGKLTVDDGQGGTYQEQPTLAFYSGIYYPRLNLSDSRDNNISIGVPLALGFSGSVSANSGGSSSSSFSFGLDIPAMFDFSFGHGCAERNRDNFGGFIGGGFGFTLSKYGYSDTYYGNSSSTAKSLGPVFHAGIRFPFTMGERDMSYTIRLMYKKGLDEAKFNIFSVGVLLEI